MKKFLIIVLVLATYETKSDSPPNNECVFVNCRCSRNSDNSLDVLCISGDSETVFPRRSNEFNDTNLPVINTFLIKRFKFKQIPDDSFKNLEIRNLIIGENQMERLTENAFRYVKSLGLLRVIEKNFHLVEPNAFQWIKQSLTELGLWQLNFKSKEIDSFFKHLSILGHLKTLNLMGYYLTEFKPEWTKIFANLTSLSLASNDLRSLSPSIFENAKQLQSLDLSNNFLVNLSNVFEALRPLNTRLRELKLYGNSIDHVEQFPELPSLQTLDLSNNKIKVIQASAFIRLTKLTNLYLSNNLINKIEPEAFERLSKLNILLLNNNYLTQTPIITYLAELKILDLSNQNGHMRVIHDYSFSRVNTTRAVNVNLDLNDIERFGEKSFCSRHSNTSEITNLDLSYSTVKRLDKCIFMQLNSRLSPRVSLNIGLYLQSANESSSLCNCEFKMFMRELNIDLIGGCTLLAKSCEDNKSVAKQTCLDKTQFQCD